MGGHPSWGLGEMLTTPYHKNWPCFEMDTVAFENRVLRRMFGLKRDKVMGEWRKLHNEDLTDVYSLSNIIHVIKSRRMRWAGHVAYMEERRDACKVLVGKPDGRRSLGRPRHRWEDNIKMDHHQVGFGGRGMDWIDLAQDRDRWLALVNTVLNLQVPQNTRNFLTS
jgi:hypothetical protein